MTAGRSRAGHKRRIRPRKPPLRPTQIPRPKIIQPRLPIPFLAGKLRLPCIVTAAEGLGGDHIVIVGTSGY
jgi:hypothetical protein